MDFFPNFEWAVPKAFADAVSHCCFEEGDTFYDSQASYNEDWSKAERRVRSILQVRFPARFSSLGAKDAKSIFDSNWYSTVKVDLYTQPNKTRAITTTQGKLYSALWKGDVSLLDSPENPAKPMQLKQVMQILYEMSQLQNSGWMIGNPTLSPFSGWNEVHSGSMERNSSSERGQSGEADRRSRVLQLAQIKENILNYATGLQKFILPRDMSTAVSKQKFHKVYSNLRGHLYSEPIVLSPREAGFEQWKEFAPAIDIAVFPLKLENGDDPVELVKSAVYLPRKDADGSRFRLARHGMIL